MASSIYDNLNNLKSRRKGSTLSQNIQLDEALANAFKRTEVYERRSNNAASQYALGAMQEVDPDYTKNSYTEGDRVRNQLFNRLPAEYCAEFHYQGSVPLNVHIKGVSDVDLLVLRTDFITVDQNGPKSYGAWHGDSPVSCLYALRSAAQKHLTDAFPEVIVDASGAKCLTLSGGSLRRHIDVIPCHSHDSIAWQFSAEKKDRAIEILNSKEGVTLRNLPFLHIHKIHSKDLLCAGGAKKIIRLLKNVSADAEIADSNKLSSYDIASLVWHFPDDQLSVQVWNELALVAVAQSNIEQLLSNRSWAVSLQTPDGSRCILDSADKVRCLEILLLELDNLASQIAVELGAATLGERTKILNTLRESYIPEMFN